MTGSTKISVHFNVGIYRFVFQTSQSVSLRNLTENRARQREVKSNFSLFCCSILQIVEKQRKCRWLSDRALPEVRRLNSVFYNKYHTETSLLPPSVCCKLPAAEGVAINRKYEQIINTVTNRTSGQNDFIFSIFATGQVRAECHQAITSILLVECGRSVQNCLARAFAKLIHLLCFQS